MARDFLIRILGDASKGIAEVDKFSKKVDDLTAVGRAGMIMGGLIAAGIGVAVAKYAEFDAAMSNVVATGADAAANQDALRTAAMDAGASTVFSATEAANAVEELAKAGISAADTLSGGLAGALDLAAAGGLGVADAAAIMATSMTQFSLSGGDATHVADLLAAGAGKAQGDVSDLSQALGQAGLVANATGLSIEETTGGLAAFASAGLLGSDAGTSFKSMLQRLTPQSAEAQAEMDRLNISAYDASGNFIGLADFAGNLQESLRSLTPEQRQSAMATIFGSDAVRAATILYAEGAEGIEKWTAEVNDQGYAAEVARKKLDNLKGDIEGLGGAIDTALIQSGSGANDTLRALTTAATGAVQWFSELPDPLLQTGLYLATATAAVGLFGGAGLTAVPKFIALKDAIAGTSLSMKGLALAAGGATLGLTAGIAIVATLAAEQAKAAEQAQAYAATLEEGTQAVTENTRNLAKEALAAEKSFLWMGQGSAYDNAEALGIGVGLVTEAAMGSSDAMLELQRQMEESTSGHDKLGLSAQAATLFADRLSDAVKGEAGSLEEAIDQARQKEQSDREIAASTEAAVDASRTAAAAYFEEAEKIAAASEELDKLIDSLNEANGVNQDAVTTNAAWQESLAGIAADVETQRDAFEKANGTVSGFSLSLAENTVTGSANAAMLAGVASDAQKAAEAQFEVDKKTVGAEAATANMLGTLASQRQAFVDSAISAGYNAEEVQGLADRIFALPPSKMTAVIADTAAASTTLARFIEDSSQKVIRIGISTYAKDGPAGQLRISTPGAPDKYAGGGEVRGPGTGTSDSIAAWLSNGEFIVRESVARKNLDLLHHLNAGGRIPAYARGGIVGLDAASSLGSNVPMLGLSSESPTSPRVGDRVGAAAGDGAAAGSATRSQPTRLAREDLDYLARKMGDTIYPLIMAGAQRTVRSAMRG